jgi:hypothetical protein
MDLSSLGSLRKIAGVAGIAIGMIVLLVRPIIERTTTLPVAERAPTFRLLAWVRSASALWALLPGS